MYLRVLATLCFIIFGTQLTKAHDKKDLPFLSIGGNAGSSSVVTVKADLKANNLKNPLCYSTVYRRGIKLKNPHIYSVYSNSFAGYEGQFYLDINLNSRLLRKLRDSFDRGNLDLGSGVTPFEYKSICNFVVKGVEFNVDDTLLVLRQKVHTLFENVFEVSRGTTTSQTFDFNTSGYINFDIYVID